MIDPFKVTDYNRTDAQLEEFLIFCMCVAGKTAVTISAKVDHFIRLGRAEYGDHSPFCLLAYMRKDGRLRQFMRRAKLGKYSMLALGFRQLLDNHAAGMSLRTCSVDELEEINGIGPKTSRFFALHSRPALRVAVLDTHVLHYLRDSGINAPRTTPASKRRYAQLEAEFIALADKAGKGIAEFDLEIWKNYTRTKPLEG